MLLISSSSFFKKKNYNELKFGIKGEMDVFIRQNVSFSFFRFVFIDVADLKMATLVGVHQNQIAIIEFFLLKEKPINIHTSL